MDLTKPITKKQIDTFVDFINGIADDVGFRLSSRGWGYIMEQKGLITKDQFDKIEDVINRCRKNGLLPVDFVADESARAFSGVEGRYEEPLGDHIEGWLEAAINCDSNYVPNWWKGEDYYIQMVVEKIDLVSLFEPICQDYHIPIANSKGWASILQRAEYCRRFAETERDGLKCVLLYCGDHDPDGLRISDTLRRNLEDVKDVRWNDGTPGYDPTDLVIDRFGLEYKFIIQNNLTWIDNLITGRGLDLSSPAHPNHKLPYMQNYLKKVGARKCEANSVVIVPKMGQDICRKAIEKYLGKDSPDRFAAKRRAVRREVDSIMERLEIREPMEQAIRRLREGNY